MTPTSALGLLAYLKPLDAFLRSSVEVAGTPGAALH